VLDEECEGLAAHRELPKSETETPTRVGNARTVEAGNEPSATPG